MRKRDFIKKEYEQLKELVGEEKTKKYYRDGNYNFMPIAITIMIYSLRKLAIEKPIIFIIVIFLVITIVFLSIRHWFFL